jgi:hypothetical protein
MKHLNDSKLGLEEKKLLILLKAAIDKVYKEERGIFDCTGGSRRGLEQAFVFRTGLYLNDLIKETQYAHLDLDCEYNKNQNGIKSTERFPQGVRPDLLLHRRGSNEENILAVEFKGWWNKNTKKDIMKLEDLTLPWDNYKYLIGVFVHIGKDFSECKYRYFIGGNEIA